MGLVLTFPTAMWTSRGPDQQHMLSYRLSRLPPSATGAPSDVFELPLSSEVSAARARHWLHRERRTDVDIHSAAFQNVAPASRINRI
jgi:hypothetical protein